MASEFQLAPPVSNQPGTQVVVGDGARGGLASWLERLLPGRPYVVIGDTRVLELWLSDIALDVSQGFLELPPGEAAKTPEVLMDVCRQLHAWGLPRTGFLVAIGGGATGDVAGLAASLHLRGVPIVQVPTTLLAMVDAGLGGKCAVNLPEGKNLLGSFWAPTLTLVDPAFLSTLPELEFRAGLGEVAKYAIGCSLPLFELLETSGASEERLLEVVEACLRIKAAIVEEDPFEQSGGRRVLLNLGHTSAHALESWAAAREMSVPHGLAVAWGLRVALRLAGESGELDTDEADRCNALLDQLVLPGRASDLVAEPPRPDELLPFLARDKKRRAGELRFVQPTGLGACAPVSVSPRQLLDAMLL